MDERHIVTVFHPETEWQGDLLVQELKDAGIEAYLANRSSANLWGVGTPVVKMEILVPEPKAREAKELIDTLLSERADASPEEPLSPEQEEEDEDKEPDV